MAKTRASYDFESFGIEQRPDYPPKPCGLATHVGGTYEYAAWDHASENGVWSLKNKKLVRIKCDDPRSRAQKRLIDARKCDSLLGHNSMKFDEDVAVTHMRVPTLPWSRQDDSLFARFLVDPHAASLSLKPSAQAVLGEAPDEQDAVFEWLFKHNLISKTKGKYQKDAGAHIQKAPGSLVAAYAMGDLTRSEDLFDHDMKIIKRDGMVEAYDREREVAPILLANEREGMRVDVERLERDLPIYEAALLKVEKWLCKKLRVKEINWDSDDEVADALASSGVVKVFPMTAPSKRFPEGQRSVSKTNLTKRFFTDPSVYDAMVYRNTMVYVLTQNVRPWLESGRKTGKIYTIWNQVRSASDTGGARSGRITCSKWQNIIKNPTSGMNPDYVTADDARIRKLIGLPELPLSRKYCLPDEGDRFCHVDWNQQELRLLAHYEDGKLAQTYIENPAADIHGKVQEWMHSLTPHRYEREPVKRANFLTAYGGGASALARRTHMPLDEAKQFLSIWKKAMPDVVKLNGRLMGMYERGEPIRTFGGRLYRCKPSGENKAGRWVDYAYTALNYLLQPSGADLIKMAIIKYHKHPNRQGRMLNIVHDEMNVSAKSKIAKQEVKLVQEVMEGIKLDVPWKSDGDDRPNWGEK